MPDASALVDTNTSIGCDVDGGGEITIDRRAHDSGLLKLQKVRHFVLQGKCKDDSCSYDLLSSPDDNGFFLDRTSDAVCAQMEEALP